jgi:hypothetical protein
LSDQPPAHAGKPPSEEITDYSVINALISDYEGTEAGDTKIDKFELIKRGDIQKLLMQIPPDFDLAHINGVSHE